MPAGAKERVVRYILEARETELRERRDFRQCILARAAEHGDDAQLARGMIFDEVRYGADAGGNLIAEHVSHHRRAAAVRCRYEIEPVFSPITLTRNSGTEAGAGMPIAFLPPWAFTQAA